MPTLTILLDSNEYIFGLSGERAQSVQLLNTLASFRDKLPRFVLNELHDNLTEERLKKLYRLVKDAQLQIIEERVPLSLIEKYQKQLPPEDAVIAAYCEFLKVTYLISENRHFLVDFNPKGFEVLAAQNFLDRPFS